jgi:hypothetical protein
MVTIIKVKLGLPKYLRFIPSNRCMKALQKFLKNNYKGQEFDGIYIEDLDNFFTYKKDEWLPWSYNNLEMPFLFSKDEEKKDLSFLSEYRKLSPNCGCYMSQGEGKFCSTETWEQYTTKSKLVDMRDKKEKPGNAPIPQYEHIFLSLLV